MAVLTKIVERIRRRIHDDDMTSDGRPLYPTITYSDAIGRGLDRVNLDLGQAWSISTIPSNREFIVELRGMIEMCKIRAAEAGSSDVSDSPETPIQTVSVPNLMVQKFGTPAEGPKSWRKMCQDLEDEYASILDTLADQGSTATGAIQQGVMMRKSLRTGYRKPFVYDTPLDPVTLAIGEVGGVVTLVWGQVSDERFARYVILRSVNADMSGSENLALLPDNHTTAYSDTPGTGTWYYRLDLYNDNDLVAPSAIVSVVIP